MRIGIEVLLIILLLLFYFDIMLVCRMLINKAKKKTSEEKREWVLRRFIRQWIGKEENKDRKEITESLGTLKQTILFPRFFRNNRDIAKYRRGLKSKFKLTRIQAAVKLGVIGTESARFALEEALLKENKIPVRLYIANSLADIGDERSIPVLISSLLGAHECYRNRVNMLIASFGDRFNRYLPNITNRIEIEIKELIIDFATMFISKELKIYLFEMIDGLRNEKEENVGLAYKAAEAASLYYFNDFEDDKYLKCENIKLRNIAVKALANINSRQNLLKLKDLLEDEKVAVSALYALSRLISNNPGYIRIIVNIFVNETNLKVKERLAEALAGRIEYFIMKLLSNEGAEAAEIIKQIIILGKTSEIIGFMNKNKDLDIENELVTILRDTVKGNETLEMNFCIYLKERLLKKCGLNRCEVLQEKKDIKKEKNLIRVLYTLLILMLLIFPLIYIVRHYHVLPLKTPIQHIRTYIINFNYYIVFYSILVNMIYRCLFFLSRFNVFKQVKLWNLKSMSMLFKKRMLPGVSIIAPAFNEEKTIIESINSLLNLKYPDYELIIVNDGSKDDTLQVVVEYFNLERKDKTIAYSLKTQPVRGVYINPSYPKLIVVDKENGGKADSLNAGINISGKEYFCGIDSDSLLEEDALLKLASQTMDESCETPALGGNVFPINGCKVEKGYITDIRIPRSNLARLQTIEYIRAFMAGRLGWAQINSLLIISGAFGLFHRERIIGVGGYLTSNEKYGRDTVGEDMELVVRVSRLMRELGIKYRICYSYNANCWTEVPEDLASLKRQRYRWHRGLIEILHFHRKIMFNPNYGRMGLIAMPYFFIFEMMGPLVEVQGYIMVIAALLLGLLNTEIALLLFISNIMLGVFVSLSALIIAEKNNNYFTYGDSLKLVLYAIIENFGPRQIFALWRFGGYLKMFTKPQGWGEQTRKGFTDNKLAMGG